MKYYCYNTLTEDDKDIVIRVTREEAIRQMRESCIRHRGVDLYPNDEEALLDFIAVNWAWEEQNVNEP